ncbi:MAG: penicillin-binding transpeptidase domain-containing protein, partial [Spirochaetia bacterium]|nr:penicillin-binding transpeptidase domain-containing protein [Spirochaetia bacterium]
FLNLALQAKFPPASTFKPMVAIAALESPQRGDLNENTEFFCPGHWKLKSTQPGVPPTVYGCWERRGHGRQPMLGGITHSCNVYFYQLGYRLGPTPIIHMAQEMGLGRPTGIDLPGEISGFVPDQRWKQLAWSSRWYDGDTVNLAIGQGFLEVTPMELAVLYAAIVNRGKVLKPYLMKEIRDPATNRLIRKAKPELIKEIPISEGSRKIVTDAMRNVVESGTGRYLLNPRFPPVAGKTGTAQTRSGQKGVNHAWFAGFAPYGAPLEEQIVVVVFLEYGMGGAATAIPVAGEVFRAALPDWTGVNLRKIKRSNQTAPPGTGETE